MYNLNSPAELEAWTLLGEKNIGDSSVVPELRDVAFQMMAGKISPPPPVECIRLRVKHGNLGFIQFIPAS